jgi:LCP family protein required for cell wall assembly
VAVAVILGMILGVGAFYTWQVQAALNTVATESFDPDSARFAIQAANPSDDEAVFVEPAEFEPTATGPELFDLEKEMAELKATWNLELPFDPYEFSPHSFGVPIHDELFTSYLLVGTDATGLLADAVILALQPSDSGAPIMVSLPRDLYVWNTCKGTFTRLNAGLGGCDGVASGMEMMAILVEDYTGVPVDHMARINFSGFANLVNAMGGVTICVDYPTRDVKSKLDIARSGCINANGSTALAWVRSRQTEQLIKEGWVRVTTSDYARQSRQQDVLFQLAGKAAGFSSPASLTNKLSAVASSVRLDSGWTLGSAIGAAWQYRGITKSSVARFSIAATDYRTPRGAAVLIPSRSFIDQLSTVYSFGPAGD